MKSDKSSNFNANGCAVQRSIGKSYTVFIPTSIENSRKIKTNPVVKRLAKQFDFVINTPHVEHCFTPARAKVTKCKWGIEATALRRDNKKGYGQEEADRDFIFKIADGVSNFDNPILLDVNDNITLYFVDCKKSPEYSKE